MHSLKARDRATNDSSNIHPTLVHIINVWAVAFDAAASVDNMNKCWMNAG
jgi:hypothetical protein